MGPKCLKAMSRGSSNKPKMPPSTQNNDTTVAFQKDSLSHSSPIEIRTVTFETDHSNDAIRWKRASVIFCVGYFLFLLREWITSGRNEGSGQLVVLLAAFMAQCTVVTLGRFLKGRSQQFITSIGTITVACSVLSYIQFSYLGDPRLTEYFSVSRKEDMQVLLGNTWALPWFALVV